MLVLLLAVIVFHRFCNNNTSVINIAVYYRSLVPVKDARFELYFLSLWGKRVDHFATTLPSYWY